ncbi:Adenylylsulfatase HINT3 [Sesamum alatum]|uniref:Adenylylsulfatase HINT3 n=1 Tax=Sesamum alatum TaxID=300844 RepID=A0AAE1Z1Q0_9LAMI|nr:Adenylylsulfatase HINT3 [Sesamum alatum]
MEARVRRRLSLLSSHINPSQEALLPTCFSASPCSSWDSNGGKEVKGQQGCVFCTIIRGEAPALKVYEDDACLCILDTFPLCHGHSLIIPKCHFPSLDVTPPSIIAAMCSKVPLISNAIMKATSCDSFNLLVNNGAAAGQVIYHVSSYQIPTLCFNCPIEKDSIQRRPLKLDQEGSQLADRIRENLSFVNRYEDGSEGQASTLVGN